MFILIVSDIFTDNFLKKIYQQAWSVGSPFSVRLKSSNFI